MKGKISCSLDPEAENSGRFVELWNLALRMMLRKESYRCPTEPRLRWAQMAT